MDYLFFQKQIVQFICKGVSSESNSVFTGAPQWPIRYSKIITHAGDWVIFTSSKDLHAIQRNLGEDISDLASWFPDNELIISLIKGKTEVMQYRTTKELSLSVNKFRINTKTS